MRNALLLIAILCVFAAGSVRGAGPMATSPDGASQAQERQGRGAAVEAPPAYASTVVMIDRRVQFRIYAPKADEVRVVGTDIPHNVQGAAMTRNDRGIWEVIVGPLEPGSYRYHFNVNGVATIDPRSPTISESNTNVWSLVHVPGAEFMDLREVPHGAVSAVTYWSTSLHRMRRMHVYTPPGYDVGIGKLPVFYLLHGAGDSDESWSSVGRAGFIMDNLIAAKKAVPMIVVMPAGHTGPPSPGRTPTEEFVEDFVTDVMPYVEKNYRVLIDRPHRAIAGLSMGGNQTLDIATTHLELFTYVGVFSSGLIGALGRGAATPATPPPGAPGQPATAAPAAAAAFDSAWEKEHRAALDNAALKKGLKLFWFATGSEDRLMPTTKSTIELFKRHGFAPTFTESGGGHTWANWRDYLNEFAPQLFRIERPRSTTSGNQSPNKN